MKNLTIGVLAHVDAGKTTLTEGILYQCGKISKPGRVDNRDTFLDSHALEKTRGITIFSKQAVFEIREMRVTLLDTPGHVDFSAEMERTLRVLDYAILVIDGAEVIQGHTKTLWWLLDIYQIPTYIFINKMDREPAVESNLMKSLEAHLDNGCIDFNQNMDSSFFDKLAMCNESMMESFIENGYIDEGQIKKAIKKREVFPCFFGSALHLEGIQELLQGIEKYSEIPLYTDEFGAKIFKITRDEQGNRLTHIKLTGGRLKVKDVLSNGSWEDKIDQIRLYSGTRFLSVNEIEAGEVCALTGLLSSRAGEGLGKEVSYQKTVLEPVLSYRVIIPTGYDAKVLIAKLRQLEEEEPELRVFWNEQLQEIQAQIMGEVQIEILQSQMKDRFGVEVDFDVGKIIYKETIASTVEGVGHFEPLRHYAEVHLLMVPGEPGSGLLIESACRTDVLSSNWQRLIMTHLKEKQHRGVLTGSYITDMSIFVVSGKAHNKHTEGGDFREATYRAVRQGLKEARSVLLEPYYYFQLELPEKMIGRAMTDIEKMHGKCELSGIKDEIAVLNGSAPVVTMQNYQREVAAYTKGYGRLNCTVKGYEPCHNQEEVIQSVGYDAQRDVFNPAGSVFCSHGESYYVEWDKVKDYMHVESCLHSKKDLSESDVINSEVSFHHEWMDPDEIDEIINKTFYANSGKKSPWKKQRSAIESGDKSFIYNKKQKEIKEKYLIVDGYNIVYAWTELKALSENNLESARMRLLDILSNYNGIKKWEIIVVFDAYRVSGGSENSMTYHNIQVVFTKESQTADRYIEQFAYDNNKKYDITVATSDGLQQIMVRGSGCYLLSARDLKEEVDNTVNTAMKGYLEKQEKANYPLNFCSQYTQR
ncbi:MAG: TetM/TetW/TetO/TetS family tetracycline resistance ribosomal protection protein [Lachnoclostridium sp.]|jgi:small GTP-binding protein|nr:TetM/TetW/TetO/TetS family tetracycline resistance ribosomal protection protein [Lachnoclostridium sp.]